MRVMQVASSGGLTGGGERHLLDLARYLIGQGDEILVVTPPGPLVARAADAGAVVIEAPVDEHPSVSARQVSKAVREHRPDILHAHGARAGVAARVGAFGEGALIAYTVHGIHFPHADSTVTRMSKGLTEAALAPATDLFVMVCRADLDRGARLGVIARKRSVVIHNAVDCDRFEPAKLAASGEQVRSALGIAPEETMGLFVGRFHRQKDLPTLLAAWARLPADEVRARLVLVGDGPEAVMLKAEAARLDLGPERVVFAGAIDDPAPYYAASDMVLLSSRWEGLPYTVLEAMAAATPVVATAVDGVPEAVEHDRTGLLVPPGDADALAAAVIALAGDPSRRSALGAAARTRACEQFSLPVMLSSTRAAYQELLGS